MSQGFFSQFLFPQLALLLTTLNTLYHQQVLSDCLPPGFGQLFIHILAITDLIRFADSYKNLQEIYKT